MKHPLLNSNWFVRYKFGKPKSAVPPELPAAPPEVSQMSMQAMKVGSESKRKGKVGRQATVMTTPGFMAPAQIERRGLKTTFG